MSCGNKDKPDSFLTLCAGKSSSSKREDCGLQIPFFFVIDRVTGDRLTPIVPKETLDLTLIQSIFDIALEDLAVECYVIGNPFKVRLIDARGARTTEFQAPFALQLLPGSVSVTCQAFCEGDHDPSRIRSIAFTAVEEGTTTAPTAQPTDSAVAVPTVMPTPAVPTPRPTRSPTRVPTTPVPTRLPTIRPTPAPSGTPTQVPTMFPTTTTRAPTVPPTSFPTAECDAICRFGCIEVVQFNLFNLTADDTIRPLRNGDTIVLTEDELLTVECVDNPKKVGSMFMRDNRDRLDGVTEGFPPYTLNRDRLKTPFFENPGSWTVWCEPYCEDELGGGASGSEKNITFTVVRAE